MTRDEWREMLRREAEAWRKIGRRIERNPREYFWGHLHLEAMWKRAIYHSGRGAYAVDDGLARAIGAYWLALECEEEAKR